MATASVIAAVTCSPCFLIPLVGWLDDFLPLPPRIAVTLMLLLMLLPVVMALTAIVRIRLSGGRLVGLGWAAMGLTLSIIQSALSLLLSYAIGGLGPSD